MPYGISAEQPDCAGYAAVKTHDDGSIETIGCHESKQDAINQMVAVSLAEDLEPLGDVGKRAEVNLSAPEFMRASARRGLRLHEQGFSGDGLMPATVADARRMAAGTISEPKWRKIGAWIARHISDLDAVQGDEITPGLVAMLLWGGGSSRTSARRAQEYAGRVVAQLDAQRGGNNGKVRDTGMLYDGEHDMDDNNMIKLTNWVSRNVTDNRSVAYTNLELRAEGDGNTLVGYAAVFDSPSEPLPFTEFVRPGAFTKTLNDGADVRLLIDHEGVPLARTKSGTLVLEEDARGLHVEASLDPANPDAARVLSAMKRGDMSQMSFAFRTIKDSFNADRTVRELREVQLFDVSVVTFPAYEDTVAEVRQRLTDENTIVETLDAEPVTLAVSGALLARKRQIQIARYR